MVLIRSQGLRTGLGRVRASWVTASVVGLLAGCATQAPSPIDDPMRASAASKPGVTTPVVAPSVLTVKRGDTLYAIAFERGLDFRDIAAWNQIAPPYTIFPGQRLLLAPPQAAQPVRPPPSASEAVAVAKVAPAPSRQVFQPLPSNPPKTAAASVDATPGSGRPVPERPTASTPPPIKPMATSTAAAEGAARKPVSKPPAEPTVRPNPATTAVAPANPALANQDTTQPVLAAAEPPSSATAAPSSAGPWRWPTQGKVAVAYGVGGRKGIVIDGTAGQRVSATRDGEVVYAGGGLLGYGQLVIVKHDEVYLSAYGNNNRLLVKEGAKVKAGEPIAEMGASGDGRTGLHFELRKNGRPIDPLSLLKAP